MNNNTLLLSIKTLCANTDVNANVDPKIILPIIKDVQNIHLAPVLGGNLFEKLKTLITNNAVAGIYETLLNDYITPVMIHGVQTELPYSNYRFTNVGAGNRTSENMRMPDAKELKIISDSFLAKRVFYANKLTAFLCENSNDIPEYQGENKNGERPEKDTYFPGIYL